MNNFPWCEKYRPSDFNNIIFDDNNKKFFDNLLKDNNFPNMLFYGSPGTGKTTTIINIVNQYNKINNINNKYNNKISTIHLNASDERGIDIIRNNIQNFINSSYLFNEGIKYIIFDEVDYMTNNAQQALKCLVQEKNNNIRFCLICNYISKIDKSLKEEFIKVRFNKLPKKNILDLLKNITINENIKINDKVLNNIVNYFDNDVRSMINYLQSNTINKICLLDNTLLENIFYINIDIDKSLNDFIKQIINIEKKCLLYKSYVLKKYIHYILLNKINLLNDNIIEYFEFIIHNNNNSNNLIMNNIKCVYFSIKNIGK